MTVANLFAPESFGAVPSFFLAILIGVAPVAVVLWIKTVLFRQRNAEDEEKTQTRSHQHNVTYDLAHLVSGTSGHASLISTGPSSSRATDRPGTRSRSRGTSATR